MKILKISLLSAVLAACGSSEENKHAFTAVEIYKGKIPCADCSGIAMELALGEGGNSYRLTETYLGTTEKDSIFSRFGTYKTDTNSNGQIRYHLSEHSPHSRIFIRLHADTLEMADQSGKLIESALNYTLIRQP